MCLKFMNLPEEYSLKENSSVYIIPICYEGNMTVGSGTTIAYKSIIEASNELEYFDFDLKVEPYIEGIFVADPINTTQTNYLKAIEDINNKLNLINVINSSKNNNYKFPVIIGGDHSITRASINFIENNICKNEDFGVVVFDAHSDLREYDENDVDSWPHACITRNIVKKHKTLVLGVRSQSLEEHEFLESNCEESKNVNIISSNDIINKLFNLKEKLDKLPSKIFISFDVDVFDPSIIRNTNTPEPGGLDWIIINNLLKEIFTEKEVVGVDIVEFAPTDNCFSESFTLAKLIYKLIAYKYYLK